MKNKQRIIEGLDQSCDDETKQVANNLTEDEAEILTYRFEKDLARQEGATPITTIYELRKYENVISYKLSFQVFVWASVSLN